MSIKKYNAESMPTGKQLWDVENNEFIWKIDKNKWVVDELDKEIIYSDDKMDKTYAFNELDRKEWEKIC